MEFIPTAEKDGYNFNGWYDENGKKAMPNTVFDKLTDLKANTNRAELAAVLERLK